MLAPLTGEGPVPSSKSFQYSPLEAFLKPSSSSSKASSGLAVSAVATATMLTVDHLQCNFSINPDCEASLNGRARDCDVFDGNAHLRRLPRPVAERVYQMLFVLIGQHDI